MVKTRRLSFSRWKDPRLAVGLILICVSAVAGGFLMRGPETRAVYRASESVVPGTVVADADLAIVDVPVSLAAGYVGPQDGVSEERISQVVGAGEMVTGRALSPSTTTGRTQIVIPLLSPAPAGLGRGSVGELWRIGQEQAGGASATAERIADDVVIVSIAGAETMRVDQFSAEIQVADRDAASVLAVLGSADGIVLAQGGHQ